MISCCISSRGAAGSAALAALGLVFAVWTPYASAQVCQTGIPVNIDNGLQFVGDFLIVCEDGDWGVTMAFPFTIKADGTVDTVRLTLFSNVAGLIGGGDVYVTGSVDDSTGMSTCGLVPDITDIRATLCCGLVDVEAGVATDLVFSSAAVTAGETVWVLLVWRTQGAFSIGFDGTSADDSILGRMFLTDVGTGLPDDWVDIATFGSGFSADYAVELVNTGGAPGEFPCPPASCGDPKAGACDEVNGTPGCDNFECCTLVCELDPLCCLDGFEWTQDCVNLVIEHCTPELASADGLWRAELDNFGQIVNFFTPDQPTTDNVFQTIIYEANSQAGNMLSRRMASNYTVVEGPTIALDGLSAFTRLEADDADLAIEIEILMLDGPSGGALVKIRCENTGIAAISCKIFYYCDYDISGDFGDDEAFTIPDPANPIFAIEQIDNVGDDGPKPLWFGGCPDYEGWEIDVFATLRTNLDSGRKALTSTDETTPGSADHTAALSSPMTELQPGEIVEFQAGLGGVDFDACGVPPEPCPGDFDNSGAIDVKDLLFLLGAWGPCPPKGDCPADFDGSGAVDVKDLLFLLGAWGPC